jgi:hypothetical protein
MSDWFASGRVADLILLVLLIEGIVLYLRYRRVRRGIPPLDILFGLLAGAGLVLALRGALVGADWRWICAPLLLALVANLADTWRRSNRG